MDGSLYALCFSSQEDAFVYARKILEHKKKVGFCDEFTLRGQAPFDPHFENVHFCTFQLVIV